MNDKLKREENTERSYTAPHRTVNTELTLFHLLLGIPQMNEQISESVFIKLVESGHFLIEIHHFANLFPDSSVLKHRVQIISQILFFLPILFPFVFNSFCSITFKFLQFTLCIFNLLFLFLFFLSSTLFQFQFAFFLPHTQKSGFILMFLFLFTSCGLFFLFHLISTIGVTSSHQKSIVGGSRLRVD